MSSFCQWLEFEGPARARKAYELGWRLGWVLKIWSLYDGLDSCNPHLCSSAEQLIFGFLDGLFYDYRYQNAPKRFRLGIPSPSGGAATAVSLYPCVLGHRFAVAPITGEDGTSRSRSAIIDFCY